MKDRSTRTANGPQSPWWQFALAAVAIGAVIQIATADTSAPADESNDIGYALASSTVVQSSVAPEQKVSTKSSVQQYIFVPANLTKLYSDMYSAFSSAATNAAAQQPVDVHIETAAEQFSTTTTPGPVVKSTSSTPVLATDLSDALSSAAKDGNADFNFDNDSSSVALEPELAETTQQPVPEQIIVTPENAAPAPPTVVAQPDLSGALSKAAAAAIPSRSYIEMPRPEPTPAVLAPATMPEPTVRVPAHLVTDTIDPAQEKRFAAARPAQPAPSTIVVQTPVRVEEQSVKTNDVLVMDVPEAGPTPYCPTGVPEPYGCPYYPGQSGTRTICGVDCGPCNAPCCKTWKDSRPIPWSFFGPGEYVGPARTEHVSTYYIRVDDLLTLTYINSRQKAAEHYRVGIGDRLRIESESDETLDREVQVQPDGEITLPLIGDLQVAGKTVKELRDQLTERYRQIEQKPLITVTPLEFNGGLAEVVKAVTSQSRSAGQALDLRVTPEGTIQAPGIGSVYVQGLTLEELRHELETRYAAEFGAGLLISPALTDRATTYVFLGGEVKKPGRYTLEGPTTVMQAIQLAQGWNNGGNIHQVVIFRRDENWCLKATKIDIHAPLYGKDPCPVDDVWLRDNDLVIVPKSPILCATDIVNLYFTRGVYAVFPITFVKDFSTGSSVVPITP